ncbi:nucleotide exchange factor sil1 [Coemansia sp. RSA 1285]|nr:nucleotide exchange factor sil1 [Coemansia sp. RSA 1285]
MVRAAGVFILSAYAAAVLAGGIVSASNNNINNNNNNGQKPFIAQKYHQHHQQQHSTTNSSSSPSICTTNAATGARVCYPAVFEATSEFQAIMPGQSVPPGLHVQIDMTTGQRKARLMAPEENAGGGNRDAADALAVVVDGGNGNDGGRGQITVGGRHASAGGFPLDNFIDHIVTVASGGGGAPADPSAVARLLESLGGLEELVHDPRHARQLMHHANAAAALLQLSDPKPQQQEQQTSEPWPAAVRQLSSVVLGSAVQNNQNLQTVAVRSGAVTRLLDLLRTETHLKSLGRHVFALSAIVRGHSVALNQFANHSGFRVLLSIHPSLLVPFHDDNTEAEAAKLDTRLVRFADDLFNPELTSPNTTTSAPSSSSSSSADTAGLLADGARLWCRALVSRLVDSLDDIDADSSTSLYRRRLEYANTLQSIRMEYPDSCVPPAEFKTWLQEELVALVNYRHRDDIEEYRQILTELDY